MRLHPVECHGQQLDGDITSQWVLLPDVGTELCASAQTDIGLEGRMKKEEERWYVVGLCPIVSTVSIVFLIDMYI